MIGVRLAFASVGWAAALFHCVITAKKELADSTRSHRHIPKTGSLHLSLKHLGDDRMGSDCKCADLLSHPE